MVKYERVAMLCTYGWLAGSCCRYLRDIMFVECGLYSLTGACCGFAITVYETESTNELQSNVLILSVRSCTLATINTLASDHVRVDRTVVAHVILLGVW